MLVVKAIKSSSIKAECVDLPTRMQFYRALMTVPLVTVIYQVITLDDLGCCFWSRVISGALYGFKDHTSDRFVQWIPSHVNVCGNETADGLTHEDSHKDSTHVCISIHAGAACTSASVDLSTSPSIWGITKRPTVPNLGCKEIVEPLWISVFPRRPCLCTEMLSCNVVMQKKDVSSRSDSADALFE
ncbi:hypothetical protein TNCV_1043991 [Trichonephila clavipes]|nr:hypothetical protein TNCV_1043991 [Trichonephila clavipes]